MGRRCRLRRRYGIGLQLRGFFPQRDASRMLKNEIQVPLNQSDLRGVERLRSLPQFKEALKPVAKISALHFTSRTP
jgi:hypothetical protein